MCIHEQWTYPECGCQISHHIPCIDIDSDSDSNGHPPRQLGNPSAGTTTCSRSQSCSRSPSQYALACNPPQTHENTSCMKLRGPRSPSLATVPTDSESHEQSLDNYSFPPCTTVNRKRDLALSPRDRDQDVWNVNTSLRSCSVKHMLQKHFLEPICDDCLLDELGVKKRTGLSHIDGHDGQGLSKAQDSSSSQDDKISFVVGTKDNLEDVGRGRKLLRTSAHENHRHSHGWIWDSDIKVEITESSTPVSDIPDNGAVSARGTTQNDRMSRADQLGMKRISDASSIDLARRRPGLLQELEAYLSDDSDEKDKAIFESSVAVEVFDADTEVDEAALADVLNLPSGTISVSPASHPDQPASGYLAAQSAVSSEGKKYISPSAIESDRRFLSSHFLRTTSLALDTDDGTAFGHVDRNQHHLRQHSTVSALTTPSASADADDECSLPSPTFSPNQTSTYINHDPDPSEMEQTATLSPNVTLRQPKPRPLSTTKILRRRGMDISRASVALRINSRWGSAERDCLKGFKEGLLGRAREVEQNEKVKEDVAIESKVENGDISLDQEWSSDILDSHNQVDVDDAKPGLATKCHIIGVGSETENEAAAEAPTIKLCRKDFTPNSKISTPFTITTSRGTRPKIKTEGENENSDSKYRRSQSPAKTLLTRFTHAHNEGKSWAKNVLGGLKRSMSKESSLKPRGSLRLKGKAGIGTKREDSDVDASDTAASEPPTLCRKGRGSDPNEALSPQGHQRAGGVRTLRAVFAVSGSTSSSTAHSENSNPTHGTAVSDPVKSEPPKSVLENTSLDQDSSRIPSAEQGNVYLHPVSQPSNQTLTNEDSGKDSWQSHLARDLHMPRKAKKHILSTATSTMSKLNQPRPLSFLDQSAQLNTENPGSADFALEADSVTSSNDRLPSLTFSKNRFYEHYNSTLEDKRDGAECIENDSLRRLLSSSTRSSVRVTASSFSSATKSGSVSGSGSGGYNWNWRGQPSSSACGSGSGSRFSSAEGSGSRLNFGGNSTSSSGYGIASSSGLRRGPSSSHWYRTGRGERLIDIVKESDFDFDEGMGVYEVGIGGFENPWGDVERDAKAQGESGMDSYVKGEVEVKHHCKGNIESQHKGEEEIASSIGNTSANEEHENKHDHDQQNNSNPKTEPPNRTLTTSLIDNHTPSAHSLSSPRPRNPTPSSHPTMRLKPRAQPPSSPLSTKTPTPART